MAQTAQSNDLTRARAALAEAQARADALAAEAARAEAEETARIEAAVTAWAENVVSTYDADIKKARAANSAARAAFTDAVRNGDDFAAVRDAYVAWGVSAADVYRASAKFQNAAARLNLREYNGSRIPSQEYGSAPDSFHDALDRAVSEVFNAVNRERDEAHQAELTAAHRGEGQVS